ncbi:MAG: holo-ACP synthase [Clostridiales bacterium]|jgi:holo-[acyl-carrier protein] synthase|nr:holo-ACP synthase [Clostridiales bacterium]
MSIWKKIMAKCDRRIKSLTSSCKNIYGIGIDIVRIDRFINLREQFIKKIFLPDEFFYAQQRSISSLAGIFSAKEAVAKSLGTGFKKISPIEIMIRHNTNNKPFVELLSRASKIALSRKICEIKISITHEKKYAIAIAVAIYKI